MLRKMKAAMESVVPTTTAPAVTDTSTPTKNKKPGGRPKGSKNKVKKTPTNSTGPMRYDATTKSKILSAAKGKKLPAAHAAAIGVGYRGTPASLYQMLRNAGVTGKKMIRGRPAGSKNAPKAAPTIRRGPGRPPKATAQSNGSGLGQIEAIVARDVQTRVNAAARAAIAELEKLIK